MNLLLTIYCYYYLIIFMRLIYFIFMLLQYVLANNSSLDIIKIQLQQSTKGLGFHILFNSSIQKHLIPSFYTPSYIYSNQCPDFAKTAEHKPLISEDYEFIINTKIYTPNSFYITLENNNLLPMDTNASGYGFRTKISYQLNTIHIVNYTMISVIQKSKKKILNQDGIINLNELAKHFIKNGQIKHETYQIKICTDYCQKKLMIIEFGKPINQISAKKQVYEITTLFMENIFIGEQKLYIQKQIRLSFTTNGIISLNKVMIVEIKQQLNALGIQCFIQDHKLKCKKDTSHKFPQIKFLLAKGIVLKITSEQYIQQCQIQYSKFRTICKTHFQINQQEGSENLILFGLKFLEIYPVVHRPDAFIFHKIQNKKVELVNPFVVFFSKYNRIIITVITYLTILFALKCYHIYYRALPRASYQSYQSVIINSSNSLSTQSEGDPQSDKQKYIENL